MQPRRRRNDRGEQNASGEDSTPHRPMIQVETLTYDKRRIEFARLIESCSIVRSSLGSEDPLIWTKTDPYLADPRRAQCAAVR